MAKFFILFWACRSQAFAQSRVVDQDLGLDVSYKIGVTAGTMKRPAEGTRPAQEFQYAGLPASFAINHEISPWFSLFYEGQIVFDFENEMVTRKGIGSGICLHMLGGSRRAVIQSSPSYILLSKNKYNLSACGRMSFFSYAASVKDDVTKRATGNAVENLFGLQYRLDITPTVALGIEAFVTLFNIPASVERIDTTSQEVLLFLRTYI